MPALHVIYDPRDKISMPPPDRRPPGVCMAMLSVPGLVEDPVEIEALARRLASLLLEQMKVTT